jgi:microsomal dipeptidase-like Zn-dependent dipeptidase
MHTNRSQTGFEAQTGTAFPHQEGEASPGEARAYDMSDPSDRDELVASLREGGMSQEAIQGILSRTSSLDSSPGEEFTESGPGEARAYDMSDPADRDELAASLREGGMSEEAIQGILSRTSALESSAEEELIGPGPGEARAYDMSDPADRDELAASLREGGISEESIKSLLTRSMGK